MIRSALIIDDELDICILLSNYLKKRNIDADYTLTLRDGLEKLSTVRPDVLFLDNNLPDGSGIDTIQEIRNRSENTRIIVISAMSNLKEKALASSADAFLDKPISFENIVEVL